MSDEVAPDSEAVAVLSDGAYTLLLADYPTIDAAWEAYETLKSIEDGSSVEIEGVVVVKRDADGTLEVQKATDHSTRSGLKWGVVGGVVLGAIFPPAILASAAVLGGAGSAAGKVRELRNRAELLKSLEDVVQPGHSGLLALVSDPGEVEIRKALEKADKIVEEAIEDVAAKDIKAAAKAADA
ncbi:DUF1269 domain-containing protein [Cellulomonas sp. URHE0023]|uniref:DUF1269 domain-containing protein n=1 Tax=Cellulomonas sp. URHE0023 TaxID=1380354 RepID=UPI0004813761|nr:DUF1269 domain-containing protein [Cellulomonas sp. URHE0023]